MDGTCICVLFSCTWAVIAAFGRMLHQNGEETLERPRRTEAGEPVAAEPLLAAELHGAVHQLEPGPGHGAPGGGDVPLAELPVIFISGYGNDETVARALELGAADYIVKPFSPTELVARIRAALRRRDRPGTFGLGELRVRYDQRRVTAAGRDVELTATEHDLLRVLTRDRLLRAVWGKRGADDPGPVRTYIKKLRHKLGDDADSPAYIRTERNVGYRMPEPESGGGP